jgi:Universal stress protein family
MFLSRMWPSRTGEGCAECSPKPAPRRGRCCSSQGDVGDVLVRLSAHAGLLVVGTREPIQGRPYLVGSISHYCISHATCPAVTVPALLADAASEPSGENSRHDELALVASN